MMNTTNLKPYIVSNSFFFVLCVLTWEALKLQFTWNLQKESIYISILHQTNIGFYRHRKITFKQTKIYRIRMMDCSVVLAVSGTVETGSATSYVMRTFRTVIVVNYCDSSSIRFDSRSCRSMSLNSHMHTKMVSVACLATATTWA